jgi:hypothetical protein
MPPIPLLRAIEAKVMHLRLELAAHDAAVMVATRRAAATDRAAAALLLSAGARPAA